MITAVDPNPAAAKEVDRGGQAALIERVRFGVTVLWNDACAMNETAGSCLSDRLLRERVQSAVIGRISLFRRR
jgi:hypothetical protein